MNKINHRIVDYIAFGLLCLIGASVEMALRQEWAQLPVNNWLWLLLILVGLGGGYLIFRISGWIPAGLPDVKPTQPIILSKISLYSIVGSVGLSAWVIFRLWPNYNNWSGTFLPWLTAIGLLIFAGWNIDKNNASDRPESQTSSAEDANPNRSLFLKVEIIGFILILCLAIFLRTYRIDSIPAGIFVDETNGALDALAMIQGNHASPFATGWFETPNMYIYFMAGVIKVFGASFVSLKLISLIPAILTVAAAFFLGRHLFGQIGGLSVMSFMAVNRWHLTLSRWGWNELMPPLFVVLALYFLIRGLKNRKMLEFSLGGTLCGLMVYTYIGSRLAVAIILFYCVYWLIAHQGGFKNNSRSMWKGLALFWLAAIITVSPLLVTYFKDPLIFFNRTNQINIFNDVKQQNSYQPLVDNLVDYLKFFHQIGDHNGRHNLPGEPELDPISGLLFVFGIGYSIFRFKDTRSGLLWIWIPLGLAGGFLSSRYESPQAYRTIVIIPAIALFCASVLEPLIMGIHTLLSENSGLNKNLFNNTAKISASAIFPGAILLFIWGGALAWESKVYFGPQADSEAVKYSFNFAETQIAREMMKNISDGDTVYLTTNYYHFSPIVYLSAGVMEKNTGNYDPENKPYRLARPAVNLPITGINKNAVFYLDMGYKALTDYFKLYYPNAIVKVVPGPGGNPLYIQVNISQEDILSIQGLKMRVTHSDGRADNLIAARLDYIVEDNDVDSVGWSGGIRMDTPGLYEIKNEGNLAITIDGNPLTGARFFCSGLHNIMVTQKKPLQNTPARLSWVRPDGTVETVPDKAFFQVNVPQLGLSGQYYNNSNWEGDPVCAQVTPYFSLAWPDGEPVASSSFSAKYSGYLKITKPGSYHFTINADDGARLTIDHKIIGEGVIPGQPNNIEVDLELEVGYHPIQLDYFQSGGGNGLDFFWQPPESDRVPVPPSALLPAK